MSDTGSRAPVVVIRRLDGDAEARAWWPSPARQPNVFICASSFHPGAQRLYERLGGELRASDDDRGE